MSTSASGSLPGSGAGAMVLEIIEQQPVEQPLCQFGWKCKFGRDNVVLGTMTAQISLRVQKCIQNALKKCRVSATKIDTINLSVDCYNKDSLEIQGLV
jgi:hypothetical protein